MAGSTSKERFLIFNTLACIPTLLQGKAVLIDLRNETSVAGRIENADGFMNIHLIEAVFIDRHGQQFAFDEFMVKNRLIRQIQIPESVDIAGKLNKMLEKVGKKEPPKTKRHFAQKRAADRHKKILNEIAAERNKKGEK